MPDVTDVVTVVAVAVVAAGLGALVGRLGRKRAVGAAVASAEERLQNQTLLQAQDLADLRADRHRLTELLVNLPETVSMMGSARSTSALCRITVRAVMDLVEASRVGLFLARSSPPRFELEVFAGETRPEDSLAFELGEGRLGKLAELIGVRTAADVEGSGRDETAADRAFGPDLCVTARRHGTVHAFVVADGPRSTDPMTHRVLQIIADVHAVSAEGLKLLHSERAKAELDKLTGLFNRHHLDRRLGEEVARARSYALRLSVFLFDVDHFKHYNDTNGHQAGDECLRWVAAVARKLTRASDVICRYGGEEFLIIHLGSGRDEAWHHADRVRKAIAGTEFPGGPSQPLGRVSVSGGVASFPEDASDAAGLVALADQALYAAKASGRNRILRVSDVGEPQPDELEAAARVVEGPPASAHAADVDEPRGWAPEAGAELRGTSPVLTPLPVPLPPIEERRVPPTGRRQDVRRSEPVLRPLAARIGSAARPGELSLPAEGERSSGTAYSFHGGGRGRKGGE